MTGDERERLIGYVRGLGASKATPVQGDAKSGEQMFWGKANCGRCHTVGRRGGRLGPDLTEIGLRRSATYLRATLLDPAANIPDSFTFYRRVVFMPDNFVEVRVVRVRVGRFAECGLTRMRLAFNYAMSPIGFTPSAKTN